MFHTILHLMHVAITLLSIQFGFLKLHASRIQQLLLSRAGPLVPFSNCRILAEIGQPLTWRRWLKSMWRTVTRYALFASVGWSYHDSFGQSYLGKMVATYLATLYPSKYKLPTSPLLIRCELRYFKVDGKLSQTAVNWL